MSTELKTISSRAITKLKMEEAQPRLTRSSSLDRIKRFNTFICSQQYYILPTLLNWLKVSQSNLHASTETTTYFLKAFILNAFLKFYLIFFKQQQFSVEKVQILAKRWVTVLIDNVCEKFSKPTFLLSTAVYFGCFLVIGQLIFSLYLIYLIFLPQGFLFLVGCMLTIQYLCYKTMVKLIRRPCSRGEKKMKIK